MGLALVADFRVGSPQSRFSANFNRLGIHPGFGISHTLPRVVGAQKAAWMLYTGERISAQQALALGLIDALSEDQDPFATALAMAEEIARSAPGAVQSTRRTLRAGFADHVMQVNRHECAVQLEQFRHPDFLEGVRAAAQRRVPVFQGR
ncbi:2,3-dehydroadipyl-CoA hydratase [compost metagenome]